MKDRINYLKEKHTVALCIMLLVVYLIIFKGVKLIVTLAITSDFYSIQLIGECVGVILSVIIMYLVGKEYILREKGEGILKGLFLGGVIVVIGLWIIGTDLQRVINSAKYIYNLPIADELVSLPQIAIFVFAIAGVGITEEFIFRGIILNLLIDKFGKTPKGIYASIAISSIMFGMAHITNIISGVSIIGASIQAFGAVFFGALMAAIYLRTRNIWVVVILHAFNDFSSMMCSALFGGIISPISQISNYNFDFTFIRYSLIYLVLMFVLLRKKKLSKILENVELQSKRVNLIKTTI